MVLSMSMALPSERCKTFCAFCVPFRVLYADIPPGSGEREYLLLYGEGSGQLT